MPVGGRLPSSRRGLHEVKGIIAFMSQFLFMMWRCVAQIHALGNEMGQEPKREGGAKQQETRTRPGVNFCVGEILGPHSSRARQTKFTCKRRVTKSVAR